MLSKFEFFCEFFGYSTVEQADVYGRLIPSISSFISLIKTLPDGASRNEFIRRNNLWVYSCPFKYNPENCSSTDIELNKIRELRVKLLRIEKKQIELSGMNFPEYIQSRAVVHWFLHLWGNYPMKNLQLIIRGQDLKEIPNTRLRPYPEYVIAENTFQRLDDLISSPIWGGSESWDLVKERKALWKQLAKAVNDRKTNLRKRGVNLMYPYTCVHCGKYISIHEGKTCGSPKCLDDQRRNGQNDRQKKSRAEKIPVANPKQNFFKQSEPTKCSRCKGRELWSLTRELLCRKCDADRITS
jgi:hypothetical protein